MSIFNESKSYRPFKYPWAVEAAEKHSIDMYWDVHQVELQDDLRQYNQKEGLKTKSVSHKTNKHIIDSILCLFTEMDRKVGEGYTALMPYVNNNEVRNLMMTFAAREVTHQRAYALLAETFGFSDSSWTEFSLYKEMVDKLDIMQVDSMGLSDPKFFAMELTKLLLSEGIGLFSAFAVLLNFKRQGLLMGFNDVNQWSLADEQEHVTNNIKILGEVKKLLSQNDLDSLEDFTMRYLYELAEAEKRFIDLVFEMGGAEDLTKKQLYDYVDYLVDLRTEQLGYGRMTKENPLPWMVWLLSASRHDNFFEKKVVDYDHSGLVGEVDYSIYAITP